MAVFYGDSNIVPSSITAKTAARLEKDIHKMQLKTGCEYKFINFYFDPVKSVHVGWYYKLKNDNEILQGAIDAKVKK